MRRRIDDALALALFVSLSFALYVRTWVAPRTRWLGVSGDPAQHAWFLRWVPHALAHGDNPLFSTHVNYPDGVNLMWNTSMPLIGVLTAPVTLLGGPVLAYNTVVTLGVALSGWSAYVVLRRYVENGAAALAGGLVYGFSPYIVAQSLTHSNLVQAYIPPILVLVLDEALVRQRRSPYVLGGFLGMLATVQLLIGEELLATEAIAASVTVVILIACWPRAVMERLGNALPHNRDRCRGLRSADRLPPGVPVPRTVASHARSAAGERDLLE